jgi:hypothetical protein
MSNSGMINTNAIAASYGSWYYEIYWRVDSQDVGSNSTVIAWDIHVRTSGGNSVHGTMSLSINVNGGGIGIFGEGSYSFSNGQDVGGGVTRIYHDASGGKVFGISASGKMMGQGVSASGAWDLPWIARASNPSVSGSCQVDGVSSITIYMNRKSTSFWHYISYSWGSKSGEIASSVTDQVTWTPPFSLVEDIAQDASGFGTINTDTYYGGTKVGSGSCRFTLTNPGASAVSVSSSSVSLGQSFDVSITKNAAFIDKVSFNYASKTAAIINDTKTVKNPINTADYAADILAATTKTSILQCSVTAASYYGTTQIGKSSTFNVSVTIPNIYAPTISNFAIIETALGPYGVRAQDIVRYISKKKISCNVTGKNGATISEVFCRCGSASTNMTASGSTYSGNLEAMTSGTISIMALDSRGFTSNYNYTGNFYEYTYPTITGGSLERVNATSNTGYLKANGKYWNGSVNNHSNYPKCEYKLNTESSYTTPSITYSAGNWSNGATAGVPFSNLTYTDSFTANVIVTDSFGQSASANFNLNGSDYTVWHGKHTVRVNQHLIASGNIRANLFQLTSGQYFSNNNGYMQCSSGLSTAGEVNAGSISINWKNIFDLIYPVGSIYSSTTNTNPKTLFGVGTWEAITDKFLIGASSNYPATSTGGEATHTLTVNELPAHYHHQDGINDGAASTGHQGTYPIRIYQDHIHNWPVNNMDPSGGGSAFSEIPPYYAVYMWRRTA